MNLEKKCSQFLIAAPQSGSGKTLITLGILAALAQRGYEVQPFKCGPDFIDPTLHGQIVSRTSINLDLRMMGEAACLRSYAKYGRGAQVLVTEGVMGLFDGGRASSAALAKTLDIPVLLVVDCRGAAESIAALIKGFEMLDPEVRLCGVVCNRVASPRHQELIAKAIQQHCNTPVIGFFPREEKFSLPSRHLGLHMGHELSPDFLSHGDLTAAIEKHLDLDLLFATTEKEPPQQRDILPAQPQRTKARIGIARDEAFCFYYQESFDILRACGFDLVFFSPLADPRLPEDVDLLYFGGGYPELYAEKLTANTAMRYVVKNWAAQNGPIYAECGGFMYLCSAIYDGNGQSYPMCDVFAVTVAMRARLSALGYREAILQENCWFGEQGTLFFGHEFRYSDIVTRDAAIPWLYRRQDGSHEGCIQGRALGSYLHLHFAQTVEVIAQLADRIKKPESTLQLKDEG